MVECITVQLKMPQRQSGLTRALAVEWAAEAQPAQPLQPLEAEERLAVLHEELCCLGPACTHPDICACQHIGYLVSMLAYCCDSTHNSTLSGLQLHGWLEMLHASFC